MFRNIFPLSIGLLCFSLSVLIAQERREKIEGTITYISSQNIYIEFSSTAGLRSGDTVFVKDNGSEIPFLLIRFISSRSVAGEKIGQLKAAKGTKVYAFRRVETAPLISVKEDNLNLAANDSIAPQKITASVPAAGMRKKSYDGRLSVQSSSDFNSGDLSARNLQRWRYTFTMNLYDIQGSGIDFQTYSNYSYSSPAFLKSADPLLKNLRVYSFNARYAYDSLTNFRLGRFQSNELASLGPVDGIVAERNFRFAKIGAIFGSHPDFSDYGYNFNFMQFGAYAARQDTLGEVTTDQSAGVFQQMNKSEIDRRFLYYQNSANIIKTINLFFSTEFDFYKKEAGVETVSPQLTGIFTSVRYSPFSSFSIGASYDARRNIIYYETYKSFLDSVIINELRQGIRLNIVLRPFKGFTLGLNNSYRRQKGDSKTNNNFGGYLYYYRLPYLEVSPVINYTRLSNSFTDGYSISLSLTRNLFDLFDVTGGYRLLHYTFLRSNASLEQQTYTFDLYYSLTRNLSLGINFESSHETTLSQNRLFVDLTARF